MLRIVPWLLAGTLALSHAWMVYVFAVDFPFQDDFTQLLRVPGDVARLPSLAEKVAYLVSSSGDHRPITLRLAALFQADVMGRMNFRELLYYGNLLCACTGLLILSVVSRPFRPWLTLFVSALLFSPANVINQYWASASLQHYSLLAYVFGALFCLSQNNKTWRGAGLFLMLCAALTGSNGLMVLPAGAVLIYMQGHRRSALLLIALACALFPAYFAAHEAAIGHPSVKEMLGHPVILIRAAVATLGSSIGNFEGATATGAVITAIWIWLLVDVRSGRVSPLLFAWISFLFLSAAAIGLGRASFGADMLLNSRYKIYSELAVIVTLIAVLARIRAQQGAFLLAVLLPLTAVWFWQSREANLPVVGDIYARQIDSRKHYAVTGRGITWGEFPPQEFADWLLLRAFDDGDFNPPRSSEPASPVTMISEKPTDDLFASPWTRFQVDGETITVGGLIQSDNSRHSLWLRSADRFFSGQLQAQRLYRSLIGADTYVFSGVFAVDGIAPGRYRIGFSAASGGHPQVSWSDKSINIGGQP